MNFHSPYQVMLKGILGKTYNKMDIEIIRDKISIVHYVLKYSKDNKRKSVARKMLRTMENNIEFISRQLNQQMLEEAQDGYK